MGMLSPFTAIQQQGWSLAYGPEVGVTSGFGHLIDHMATNRPMRVASAQVSYLTNQKFGNKPQDTDLPLTDHNSVKTVFLLPSSKAQSAGYPSSDVAGAAMSMSCDEQDEMVRQSSQRSLL